MPSPDQLPRPRLDGLVRAVAEADAHLAAVRSVARDAVADTNAEGGDPALHGDARLLTRHLGHYLAAAEVAEGRRDAGHGVDRLVDVGCGTAAFSAWLAGRLGARLELADHDPAVLAAARAAHDVAATHADLDEVEGAPLVTAMEVLEHVPPAQHAGFCAALVGALAPDGVLVLSTPDESRYPGGWSGYAPHVGCVTAPQLAGLLTDAGAGRVEVWRILGGPYDTGAARRLVEAVGNRAWTVVRERLPAVAEQLERRTVGEDDGPAERPTDAAGVPGVTDVRVVPATAGAGGSLVAVAVR